MIITRTPFRVSFTGGGSDLREFYSQNGYGAVVSAAIKKYMYVVIHPYFHDKIRIKYSRTEDVRSVEEIQHPLVRECLKKAQLGTGFEIASFADVPAGTGLGSSSAFAVGLLNALYACKGKIVTKERLAAQACEIEIDILGEPIGKQDQYAVACGNINYIRFHKDETVDVSPLFLTEEAKGMLERKLYLYYVGGERKASSILAEQKKNIAHGNTYANLCKMVSLSDRLRDFLLRGEIDSVGAILHEGWMYKKELASNISNGAVDTLYQTARSFGAEGGKLLGAGGNGFLLLFCRNHENLAASMACKTLPFQIDQEGTKILFYE